MRKRHKRLWRGILMVFALVLLCGTGTAVAKYIYKTYEKAWVEPERFIFVHDYPSKDVYHLYVNSVDNTASITVHVSNNEEGLVTKSEISYKVSVTDENNTTVNCANVSEGTLQGNVAETDEITLSGLQVDKTYTLTIQSTAPYAKTLTSRFRIAQGDEDNCYYTVDAHETWAEVTLYIGDIEPVTLDNGTVVNGTKDITINYEGFIPDNTNEMMRVWTTEAGLGTLEDLNMYSQYSFIFFGQLQDVPNKTLIDSTTNTITLH